TLTENNLPGGEYINFNNTRALTYKTIDMNTNDITNVNVLVRASNGNVINFDNDIFPPLITGALTIESGAGKEININADNYLRLNANNISHNAGTGIHQFNDVGGLQVQFTNVAVDMFKTLDMKNNNINFKICDNLKCLKYSKYKNIKDNLFFCITECAYKHYY
ncbi:MAG: hypothetical protein HWN79_19460, partial [Candidatus Lokiarchaeota archaeon]|nr:hypothetical protein [Candidatus Lokiarchaeota archaeon]